MPKRACVDKYDGTFTYGIDVSTWQQEVDWDKVHSDPQGIEFAIIRTGDGRSVDKWFSRNWKEAKRVGLIRGCYRYLRADRDGKTQAELDLKMLEENGGLDVGRDLPPVLDLEGGSFRNLRGGVYGGGSDLIPVEVVVEESLEYLETIERELGCLPMFYTGQVFHWKLSQARPELAELFGRYPLWIPSYSSCARMPVNVRGEGFPWKQYTIWQYTAKGKIDGVEGDCDVNRFRGNAFELANFIVDTVWKGSEKAAPEETVEPVNPSVMAPMDFIDSHVDLDDRLDQVEDQVEDLECRVARLESK